jgi:radical SAM protein with 4Fe4S-binding SPASM domain
MSMVDMDAARRAVRMVLNPRIRRRADEGRPFLLEVELNTRCYGGCKYCYASSNQFKDTQFDTRRLMHLIDEGEAMGIRMMWWFGGDPILHPDWYEIARYAAKKRISQMMVISGMLSKKDAELIAGLKRWMSISIHIDTVDPEVYAETNVNPNGLKHRIEGYKKLLEAGFPRNQMLGVVSVNTPTIRSFKRTIDWYVDEMGAIFINCPIYKDQGYAKHVREMEPSLSKVKEAITYRNKRLGEFLPPMGTAGIGPHLCRTNIAIHANGRVQPCLFLYDMDCGNIYDSSLKDIVEEHREKIFFKFDLHGYCRECEHYKKTCFGGCRANAYHYLGDSRASDPKCWLNPDAKELYYSNPADAGAVDANTPRSHGPAAPEPKRGIR